MVSQSRHQIGLFPFGWLFGIAFLVLLAQIFEDGRAQRQRSEMVSYIATNLANGSQRLVDGDKLPAFGEWNHSVQQVISARAPKAIEAA